MNHINWKNPLLHVIAIIQEIKFQKSTRMKHHVFIWQKLVLSDKTCFTLILHVYNFFFFLVRLINSFRYLKSRSWMQAKTNIVTNVRHARWERHKLSHNLAFTMQKINHNRILLRNRMSVNLKLKT